MNLNDLSDFPTSQQEIKDRERAKEAARAVVDSHLQRRATQIEIRPKYLLPDTNCYIDHLKCN